MIILLFSHNPGHFMPQSLTQIYVHLVFSTKNRQPLIVAEIESELHSYLGGICRELDCHPVKIGGYNDHIHILCGHSRKIALMKLVEEIKKSSSKWIKTKGEQYLNFYWQDGYGAFSVGHKQLDAVYKYIASQREHHQHQSFQDECRMLYTEHSVAFDERYVWD